MYFGTNKINDKWSLHTEAQFRHYNIGLNGQQLLLRTGINRHLSKNSILTMGYGWIKTSPEDKRDIAAFTYEHRIFQQYILRNKLKRLNFEHRFRLEERWVEANYSTRTRYRIFLAIPIDNKKIMYNTWFFAFYDEIFINISDSPFDQNRLYFAFGYQYRPNANIQMGYLKHHVGNTGYDRLQLAITYNLDFSKKKRTPEVQNQ